MNGGLPSPVVVPPAEIESTLNEIWDKLASKEGGAKMRACLFNLILITKNTPRASYIQGVAQRVIEQYPCRILFVTIDSGKKEDDLKTSVSVVGVSGHMSDVACDLIEFNVSEASAERIPFSLLPHLVTDLPTYLLWADDPTVENPISYQLEKYASRLIFDSEVTDNLPLFAKALLHHREISKCDIADLNWARTEAWRTLIFSTFRSQKRLEELANTATLKIEYNALETTFFCHTKIQAVYLQAWLSTQLIWQLQEVKTVEKKIVFNYTNSKLQPVTIELVPIVMQDLAPGAIISFSLATRGEEHFEFARKPDIPQQVTLMICSGDKCEAPTQFIMTKGGIGLTLVKEICRQGTSVHYLRVLEYLSKLESKSLC